MAERSQAQVVDVVAAADKPNETLSQFFARVLDQLSLSAWLPSAALVLGLDFVLQLGAVLDLADDDASKPDSPLGVVGAAISAMASTGLGGALLLVAAVIVLTMVTQAFSFEAIRVLEGYWGTNRAIEWLAHRRCDHFRALRVRLEARDRELKKSAWSAARATLEEMQRDRVRGGGEPTLTPNMIEALGAGVLHETPLVKLTETERAVVRRVKWEQHAPADTVRRRLNLDNRLRDFPAPERMLPTRLGNVLRRHEDYTGHEPIETFIQEVYDLLPAELQEEHDEQRTRLDLYCSMVFVVVAISLAAVVQFGVQDGWYAVVAVVVGLAGMGLMYRAAISSARAYGSLLVTIARRFPATED